MDKVEYDYHTDPQFHAAVKATVLHELAEQAVIRRQVEDELFPQRWSYG